MPNINCKYFNNQTSYGVCDIHMNLFQCRKGCLLLCGKSCNDYVMSIPPPNPKDLSFNIESSVKKTKMEKILKRLKKLEEKVERLNKDK